MRGGKNEIYCTYKKKQGHKGKMSRSHGANLSPQGICCKPLKKKKPQTMWRRSESLPVGYLITTFLTALKRVKTPSLFPGRRILMQADALSILRSIYALISDSGTENYRKSAQFWQLEPLSRNCFGSPAHVVESLRLSSTSAH